jgi:nitrogen fixation protein FixH
MGSKRGIIAAWATLLLLVAGGLDVCGAADYRARKSVDGFAFEIAINRNPPVLGKNEIRVEIRDPQGQPVSGAEVTVNYYMPPMPRMPPMNYTVTAAPDGSAYRAVMDLIMSGPWNIVVRANPGGKPVRATFPIDVR